MGTLNKLLLPVDGTPMVRRVAAALAEGTGEAPLVVLGHEADAVEEALAGLNARFVLNPDHAEGQVGSVRIGLAAAPPGAVMLALGDQPALTARDIAALALAHDEQGKRITVPVREGEDELRGNPILISGALRETILRGGAKLGCRHLTRERPDLVSRWRTKRAAFFTDIDRPEDYEALAATMTERSGPDLRRP